MAEETGEAAPENNLASATPFSGQTDNRNITQIAVYPPPHIVEAFAKELPGSPERLLAMLEKGQAANIDHQAAWLLAQSDAFNKQVELQKEQHAIQIRQIELGHKQLDIQKSSNTGLVRGQNIGVACLIFIVIIACAMMILGYDWRFCLGLISLPLGGIITAIVTAHKKR